MLPGTMIAKTRKRSITIGLDGRLLVPATNEDAGSWRDMDGALLLTRQAHPTPMRAAQSSQSSTDDLSSQSSQWTSQRLTRVGSAPPRSMLQRYREQHEDRERRQRLQQSFPILPRSPLKHKKVPEDGTVQASKPAIPHETAAPAPLDPEEEESPMLRDFRKWHTRLKQREKDAFAHRRWRRVALRLQMKIIYLAEKFGRGHTCDLLCGHVEFVDRCPVCSLLEGALNTDVWEETVLSLTATPRAKERRFGEPIAKTTPLRANDLVQALLTNAHIANARIG